MGKVVQSRKRQGSKYSGYKNSHTVKSVTGVSGNGALAFVSKLYPRSTSDVVIVEHSRFMEQLVPGDMIFADKVFTSHKLLPQGPYGLPSRLDDDVAFPTDIKLERPDDCTPEEDKDFKICVVCGERASGYYFGALVCLPCKIWTVCVTVLTCLGGIDALAPAHIVIYLDEDLNGGSATAECLTDSDPTGELYTGTQNVASKGEVCQRWDSQSPHGHKFTNLDGQANYCRNPDGERGPWCYTMDPEVRWAFCDIPSC